MKIYTISKWITATIVLFTSINIMIFFFLSSINNKIEYTFNQYHQLLIDKHALLDDLDLVIDSVDSYAETGRAEYINQYMYFKKTKVLEKDLKKIMEQTLAPYEIEIMQRIGENIKQIEQYNNQAIEYRNNNKRHTAHAVLYSRDYKKTERKIYAYISQTKEIAELRYKNLMDKLIITSRIITFIMLLFFGINMIIDILALRYFYRNQIIKPLDCITGKIQLLLKGDDKVSFRDKNYHKELFDLTRVLDDYHQISMDLNHKKEQLTTLSEELNAILENATTGISVIKDRIIIRANPAMDRIFGYNLGEQIGKKTRIWYDDEESFNRVGIEVQEAMAQKMTYVREAQWRSKDGSKIWVRISTQALDKNNPSKGLVLIADDVSAQRHAAIQLEESKRIAEDAARMKSSLEVTH